MLYIYKEISKLLTKYMSTGNTDLIEKAHKIADNAMGSDRPTAARRLIKAAINYTDCEADLVVAERKDLEEHKELNK